MSFLIFFYCYSILVQCAVIQVYRVLSISTVLYLTVRCTQFNCIPGIHYILPQKYPLFFPFISLLHSLSLSLLYSVWRQEHQPPFISGCHASQQHRHISDMQQFNFVMLCMRVPDAWPPLCLEKIHLTIEVVRNCNIRYELMYGHDVQM